MIRLATYGFIIVIFVMVQHRIGVIPVALSSPETRDAAVEAEVRLREHLREIEKIVSSRGFLDSKRSGSELLTIASMAAAGYGAKLPEFHPPTVMLKRADGRLTWIFIFVRDYGPNVAVAPAETFSVTIEDETGIATVKNETALM